MDSDKKEEIVIKTSDNFTIKVETKYFAKSKFLQGLIDDYGDNDEEIPLMEINKKNLDYVMNYLKTFEKEDPKDIPKPFPEKVDEEFFKEAVGEKVYNFLKEIKDGDFIDLLNTANYLSIDGLVQIISAKLAFEMCNCDIEEARKKFGINCDMNENEIKEIEKYPLD